MKPAAKLQILNTMVATLSWATMGFAIISVLCHKYAVNLAVPGWFEFGLLPILLAGAVGYLTNYVAIWLLFKPYKPVRSLFGLQGVVPREQAALAERLGEEIPRNLLPPEELADQLGRMVRSYLQNPELLNDVRGKINIFMKRYSADIAGVLAPHIEEAISEAVRSHLGPEKLQVIYDQMVGAWLSRPANRDWLAAVIVAELQTRVPEITAAIKENVKSGTESYVREEYPFLTTLMRADEFAARLITRLNWERIREQLTTALGEKSTQAVISEELVELSERFRRYLQAPDGGHLDFESITTKGAAKAEELARAYLAEHLPRIIDNYLKLNEVWLAIENQLLPVIQSFVMHRLKHDRAAIIAGMDISGRIERAIKGHDMAKLHEMINKVSGRHLVAIQLLGYLLGAVAGVLLALSMSFQR